jgi:hypothetical protein
MRIRPFPKTSTSLKPGKQEVALLPGCAAFPVMTELATDELIGALLGTPFSKAARDLIGLEGASSNSAEFVGVSNNPGMLIETFPSPIGQRFSSNVIFISVGRYTVPVLVKNVPT